MLGPMLWPCWVIWWLLWGSLEVSGKEKEFSQKVDFLWRFFLIWSCLSQVEGILMMRSFLWVSVGPMLGRCWAALGLCWASVSWANVGPLWVYVVWGSMEVSGTKNSTPTENFSVGVNLGALGELCRTNVGPFWVYVGSMLGPCWVIWWAMWGSMEVSGTKKKTQPKTFRLGVIWGHLEGYVGPMLGRFGSMLGRCWAHVGSFGGLCGVPWRSLERKKYPQPKTFRLGVILGALGGLCRTNVGPFWVYVGSMLGHLAGNVWLHGGLWNEKFNPNRKRFGLG